MLKTIKAIVFVTCLLPLLFLFRDFYLDELGANPFEVLTRSTGEWTLRFLFISLAMTPLRILSGAAWPVRFRRLFGLYAFFYACVHLLTYLWLDHFFDWEAIWTDIVKRPYITIGMLAFVFLIPLSLTSTKKMMKRLGPRWKTLHKLAYLIAPLGVVHFLLLVKADLREPIIYSLILATLLLVRIKPKLLKKRQFRTQ